MVVGFEFIGFGTRLSSESYLGLRPTVRISYVRNLTASRGYLAIKANRGLPSVVSAVAIEEKLRRERYSGESKSFVEERRLVAMRFHTRDQAKEGEKESKSPEEGPVAKWDPTVEGYLQFLVDSKLVYDTLEGIIEESDFPTYAVFKKTGLERAEKLGKDLEWFKEQGYEIPEPIAPGRTYSEYLKILAERDPEAFICHFYNIYFAHSAGGQMIGTKFCRYLRRYSMVKNLSFINGTANFLSCCKK
ncbi:hypothetical protein CARUB_v10021525mg [Capsella rubella]|uniref:heme oxygenase (biliverdin-producing) n=1 Tax=Capsella rubella TaxID=81985 RepID=R0GE35_9BRAS|nr:hypothetical protein CARUB_v10021525mg [Capsella rubella]